MRRLFKNLKEVLFAPSTGDLYQYDKIGRITEAGLTFEEAEPTVTEFFEVGNPYMIDMLVSPGRVTFKFAVMVEDAEVLKRLRGGELHSGSVTPGEVFAMPVLCLRIISDATMCVDIPQASVYGKLAGVLGDKGQLLLECICLPVKRDGCGLFTFDFDTKKIIYKSSKWYFEPGDYRQSDFTGFLLSGASMADCDFSGSVFEGANLEKADISGSVFVGCNFGRCALTGACVVVSVDFTGSVGLSESPNEAGLFALHQGSVKGWNGADYTWVDNVWVKVN